MLLLAGADILCHVVTFRKEMKEFQNHLQI